jgi:hypothetical protein
VCPVPCGASPCAPAPARRACVCVAARWCAGAAGRRAAVVRGRAAGVRKCRAAAGPAPPARVSGGRWRRGVRRAAHRPHSPAAGAVAIVFSECRPPAPARPRQSTVRPFVFIITVFGFRTTATNPYNAANAIKRKPAITGGGEGATAGQRRAYRAETRFKFNCALR